MHDTSPGSVQIVGCPGACQVRRFEEACWITNHKSASVRLSCYTPDRRNRARFSVPIRRNVTFGPLATLLLECLVDDGHERVGLHEPFAPRRIEIGRRLGRNDFVFRLARRLQLLHAVAHRD